MALASVQRPALKGSASSGLAGLTGLAGLGLGADQPLSASATESGGRVEPSATPAQAQGSESARKYQARKIRQHDPATSGSNGRHNAEDYPGRAAVTS